MKNKLKFSISLNVIGIVLGFMILFSQNFRSTLSEKLFSKNISFNPENGNYYKIKLSQHENFKIDSSDIVIIGNSLIDYANWSQFLPSHKIQNFGIAQDMINPMTNRIVPIITQNPKMVFILIGINDIGQKKSIETITQEYTRLFDTLQKFKYSNTSIISLLPTADSVNYPLSKIKACNEFIKKSSKRYDFEYLNAFDTFIDTDKKRIKKNLTIDGIHLNHQGYILLSEIIEKEIKKTKD